MKSLLLAATLFAGVLGCQRAPEAAAPATSPAPAAASPSTLEAKVSTPGALTLDNVQHATCPRQWFCDDSGQWFGTRSQCLASCSGTCTADYNCSGNCLCP